MTRLQAAGENAPQIEYWNGAAGERWAGETFRERQDRAQGPFGEAAMDALQLQSGHHVLDIGCGSGTTTLELARRVGESGRVLGVDISMPQLEQARRRATAASSQTVEFRNQDVAILPFEAEAFDRAFSRFGVMFFVQPVAAFANIRASMKPGGRMAFACWQAPEHNPWWWNTIIAASRYLPKPELPGFEAPGPFAFQNPDRVARILSEAGFTEIDIVPDERALLFEPDVTGTVLQLVQYGLMANAIAEAPEGVQRQIKADLADMTRPYQTPEGVMIDGAVWVVSAEA